MEKGTKRGLSPIIATVLLISIALVLALIVFLWARSFVAEKTQKFGTAIEFACDDILFTAEALYNTGNDGEIFIVNKGNVAIYGAEIRAKKFGSIKKGAETFDTTVVKGASGSGNFKFSDSGINAGDEIIVVPILLGESGNFKKPYSCDEEFGETIKVI